jgi:diguanylate cyclase (GGDEF)-like protein
MSGSKGPLHGCLRVLKQPAVFFGLSLIALLWLAATQQIETERAASRQSVIQNTANLARVFEENVIRSISEVDKVLQFLSHLHAHGSGTADWSALVREDYLGSDLTLQLAVINEKGILIASNVLTGPVRPIDLSDREHFIVHAKGTADTLFISQPVLGRASNKWSVQLTRRFNQPDGSFGGVIVASLDPSHVARFYDSISLGSGGAIALVGLDGIVRAGGGTDAGDLGQDMRGNELFSHFMNSENGSFVERRGPNAVRRVVSYRSVRGYPLIVTVAADECQPMSSWARNRPFYLASASGLTLVILIAIAFALWSKSAYWASEERTRRKSRELELTLEHMSQGILMVDRDEKIAVMNRQCVRLLGLPEDSDCTDWNYSKLVGRLAVAGEFCNEMGLVDPGAIGEMKPSVADQPTSSYERSRPNGTVLEVRSNALPDGGFVRTFTDITSRRRTEAQMAHFARHDALTDLANRVLFREELEAAAASLAEGNSFALHIINLDRFNSINDSYSHSFGDKLLRAVALRLGKALRRNDVIARIGGDEFAVVQKDVATALEASTIAEYLCKELSEPYAIDGQHIQISASIGVALAPGDASVPHELMKAADLALCTAKAEGRGTYRFFKHEMNAALEARRAIEMVLRNAIDDKQFEVHYQPINSAHTKEVVGFEALLRWLHPERGLVAPQEFIPIAEENGLIVPIGAWVLNQACADMSRCPGDLRVSVNLSPVQIKSQDFVKTVQDALDRSGLAPERLELEITESTLLQNDQFTQMQLQHIRALGVRIAMDDFGTGYSSLNYLLSYPVDRIKIDRSFVEGLGEQPGCVAIVRAITALAKSLGMTTTAEGVESARQLELLDLLGCDEAQGFYFSVPRPAREILPPIAATPDGEADRDIRAA